MAVQFWQQSQTEFLETALIHATGGSVIALDSNLHPSPHTRLAVLADPRIRPS
jgi:hypothetical protein